MIVTMRVDSLYYVWKIYVPRDERFSHIKFSDFLDYALKSLGQIVVPEINALFDKTLGEFDTFQDVMKLYEGGVKLPDGDKLKTIKECIPWEMLKELVRIDSEQFLKFPMPDVIKGNIISFCLTAFNLRSTF
ncbi:Lipoxygenase domain-containing protein [Heracleum sosnowskyi]|uniref:Lipoxygenase domain-containing protein n=1 Tax=Heracleum sosnowskyi TaxID=360622 RepID=A0AAD8JE90_9APIA|nr:Lipoxygenase domain-containing protein [Heracleum sosnowskyi]